eukprot:scaffold4925_cov38-Prasinocladus_malaysianus.AAC.1
MHNHGIIKPICKSLMQTTVSVSPMFTSFKRKYDGLATILVPSSISSKSTGTLGYRYDDVVLSAFTRTCGITGGAGTRQQKIIR